MVSLSQADFGVAVMFVMVAVPIQLWRFHRLRMERLKTDRYALFAVRDHWIRLVADGHLAEDDELFRLMYDEINSIISRGNEQRVL